MALTGLYVAIKLHGEIREDRQQQAPPPSWSRHKFSLAVCASISRNQFAPREVEECERDLLATLDWHVNPVVSSGSIIDSLLAFLPSSSSSHAANDPRGDGPSPPWFAREDGPSLYVHDCAKYLSELSASVPALCLVYRPSVVSYASVLCAIDSLHQRSSSSSSSCSAATAVDGRVDDDDDDDDGPNPSSSSSSYCCRREFEARVRRASMMHFDDERSNVEGATRILRAICPNLGDLFHLPTTSSATATIEPMSPTSTIKLSCM